MLRLFVCLLALASVCPAAVRKPKLVLTVVVDQFRYDYLTRNRANLTGGFNRLLTHGAVFTNARYIHVPTITAIGHSTILTGATPSLSGIVGNDWFDPDEKVHVTSVSDPATKLVGGKDAAGSSPHRLLVSTVADELRIAATGKFRAIGISLKDRSAILPLGHVADGAYWFDTATGNFVTSTFYMNELPSWARDYNASRQIDQLKSKVWMGHTMPAEPEKLFSAIEETSFGNDLIENFAEKAITGEQLGRHEGIDLLTVSFSSNDYVGHKYGPESPEAREITIHTDQLLDKLLSAAERQAGAGNVLVVLTADHGAPLLPEENAKRHMPGGRIEPALIKDTVQNALVKKYGPGNWISGHWDTSIYLNRSLISDKGLDRAEVQKEAAAVLMDLPHIYRVYTASAIARGEVIHDDVSQHVIAGHNMRRSPDVQVLPEPNWMIKTGGGVTHGGPFLYDAHVPVIFMGPGIKPGKYQSAIAVNDIAPTLAALLEIEAPSGSVGRVLTEILVE